MEYVSNEQQFFENQQNQKFTDCSFRFLIETEDGKVEEKVIHGHKMVLSTASKYFETNFKPQWSNNEPILIETVEFSIFEKLIRAIYLSIINIECLEEGIKLYEAAHFYQMQKVLGLLRDEIQSWCLDKKPIAISTVANLAWKYHDFKLIIFVSKYFCINTDIIIEDPDFMNFTPDAINWLFLHDDELSADEKSLIRSLEKFTKEKKISVEMIKPAICSLRFLSQHESEIKHTNLLTETEKKFLLGKSSNGIAYLSKNKKARVTRSFFSLLPDNIQVELRKKLSIDHCWICKAFHNVFECTEANEKYRVYSEIKRYMLNYHFDGRNIKEEYCPIDKVGSYQLKRILNELREFHDDYEYDEYEDEVCNNFSKFTNIDNVLKEIYYITNMKCFEILDSYFTIMFKYFRNQ